MLNLAVLGSTRGTDLQAIIDAIGQKKLDAKISIAVSNKEDAYILERAKKHKIETLFVDPKKFASREDFDKKIVEELQKRKAELVLLIGYMRIVSPYFVNAFRNKIMNIHPSLLPAFGGAMDKDVHQAILDSGVKVSGCTLHFADESVDAGPIIMQTAVSIEENETVESLKEKVQKAEQDCFLKAIKLFAEGKLKVEGKKVKILQ